jgi:hypothetical protein
MAILWYSILVENERTMLCIPVEESGNANAMILFVVSTS